MFIIEQFLDIKRLSGAVSKTGIKSPYTAPDEVSKKERKNIMSDAINRWYAKKKESTKSMEV